MLFLLLTGGQGGGFVGLVRGEGFGIFVFLALDFLDVVARPLWVSRDNFPPVLMKIWRFLSGWGFLLIDLGLFFWVFSSLGGTNLGILLVNFSLGGLLFLLGVWLHKGGGCFLGFWGGWGIGGCWVNQLSSSGRPEWVSPFITQYVFLQCVYDCHNVFYINFLPLVNTLFHFLP